MREEQGSEEGKESGFHFWIIIFLSLFKLSLHPEGGSNLQPRDQELLALRSEPAWIRVIISMAYYCLFLSRTEDNEPRASCILLYPPRSGTVPGPSRN